MVSFVEGSCSYSTIDNKFCVTKSYKTFAKKTQIYDQPMYVDIVFFFSFLFTEKEVEQSYSK